MLTRKINLSEWLPSRNGRGEGMIYCLGVNKEGVRCPRASSCTRYIPNESDTVPVINFHENYDIAKCEIYIPIQNQM